MPTKSKKANQVFKKVRIEILENRVLYSADSGLMYALLDDETNRDKKLSELEIGDLLAFNETPSQLSDISTVVVIDSSVPDSQLIKDEFDDDKSTLVISLSKNENGIDVLSQYLTLLQNVEAVQIFSHSDGTHLKLGSATLDAENIKLYEDALSEWQKSFTESADILLYGCNLAATESGLQLLGDLADVTGADIAASDDLTGHQIHNANWNLEFSTGSIDEKRQLDEQFARNWEHVLSSITVTTTVDIVDGNTTTIADLMTDPGMDGEISLREAIEAANNTGGVDEILLASDTYNLDSSLDALLITEELTLTGQGMTATIISGLDVNGVDTTRILNIDSVDATIRNLTLTNGETNESGGAVLISGGTSDFYQVRIKDSNAGSDGGAIHATNGQVNIHDSEILNNESGNAGGAVYLTLTATGVVSDSRFEGNIAGTESGAIHSIANLNISNSEFIDNTAVDNGGAISSIAFADISFSEFLNNESLAGSGGAIANYATLQLQTSYFFDNDSALDGGAIYSESTVNVTDSTFHMNSAINDGGAIAGVLSGSVIANNTTFYLNDTGVNGGAVALKGFTTLSGSHLTVVDNDAGVSGGAVSAEGMTSSVSNSIFQGNTSADIFKNFDGNYSTGFNLFDNLPSTTTVSSDIISSDAMLGTLQDNGGPVPTIALQAGSLAIDSGSIANATNGQIIVDAKGNIRNEFTDIGAVEFLSTGGSNKIFWTDEEADAIYRATVNGTVNPVLSSVQKIVEPTLNPGPDEFRPTDIEINHNESRIYWVEKNDDFGRVISADFNGQNQRTVIDLGVDPDLLLVTGITIDEVNNHLYLTNIRDDGSGTQTNSIRRYTINTNNVTFESSIHSANIKSAFPLSGPRDIEYLENPVSGEQWLIWTDQGITATPQAFIAAMNLSAGTGEVIYHALPSGALPVGVTWNTTTTNGSSAVAYYADQNLNLAAVEFDPANSSLSSFINPQFSATSDSTTGIHYDAERDLVWYTRAPGGASTGSIWTADSNLQNDFLAQDSFDTPSSLTLAELSPVQQNFELENNGLTTNQGAAKVIEKFDLEAVDPDTAATAITYNVTIPPMVGQLELASAPGFAITMFTQEQINTNEIVYNPMGSSSTIDSFTFSVTDGVYIQEQQIFRINNIPLSSSLEVSNATTSLFEDTSTSSFVLNSTSHNTLADLVIESSTGSNLIFTLEEDGASGTVSINPDGTFTYQHGNNEADNDSFIFKVTDTSSGDIDTGIISINIEPVNDNPPVAVNDTANVSEGDTVTTLVGNVSSVLTNDSDPDEPHDELTAILVTGNGFDAQHGTAIVNPDGTFSYEHNGSETTSDRFYYDVVDENNVQSRAYVDVNIAPVNENNPFVPNGFIEVDEGATATSLVGGATLLTDGWVDEDAEDTVDNVQITLITDVAHGDLTIASDNTFTYIHNDSETTTDSFVYRLTDQANRTHDVTVQIDINARNDNDPFVPDSSIAVDEGATATSLVGGATLLTDGWVDEDTEDTVDNVQITLITDVAHGDLTIGSDNTFTYIHDDSETTTDSFVYRLTDQANRTHDVTVQIDINARNDHDPFVPNGVIEVNEGATATSFVGGNSKLTDGLIDADAGDNPGTVSVAVINGPENGALTVKPDSTFSYVHNDTETTTDSFVYRLTDTVGNTHDSRVDIQINPVNDPPVTGNSTATTDEDTTYIFLDSDFTFLDPSENHAMTGIVVDSVPISGSLTISGVELQSGMVIDISQIRDGNLLYIPDADVNGPAQADFTFRVIDDGGVADGGVNISSQPGTITFDIVPTNDDPRAVGNIADIEVAENTTQSTLLPSGLFLDKDNDALNLVVTLADGSPLPSWMGFNSTNGMLTINPTELDIGVYSLQIIASDNQGGTPGLIPFRVNVTEVFNAPGAISPDFAEITENTSGVLITSLQAIDADTGDTHTFEVEDSRFEFIGNELWLKPGISLDHELEPTINLAIDVTDSSNLTSTLLLGLDVLDLNDAPVAQTDSIALSTAVGQSVSLEDVLFVDQDHAVLNFTMTTADGLPLPQWLLFDQINNQLVFVGDQELWPDEGTLDLMLIANDAAGARDATLIRLSLQPQLAAAIALPLIEELESEEPMPVTPVTPVTEEVPMAAEQQEPEPEDSKEQSFAEPEIFFQEEILIGAEEPLVESFEQLAVVEHLVVLPNEPLVSDRTVKLERTEHKAEVFQIRQAIEIPLAQLMQPELVNFGLQLDLVKKFDQQREYEEKNQLTIDRIENVTYGVTTGVSVGYILWMIRSGAVLASLVSALPAWRAIDPLPVLANLEGGDDTDKESLQSIVQDDDAEKPKKRSFFNKSESNNNDKPTDGSESGPDDLQLAS